jgi:4-amino-4-deoxy-L-arabinose transferase-like glycosyltransferase
VALVARLFFLFVVVLPHLEGGVLNKPDTRWFDEEAQQIAFHGQSRLEYPEWFILYYMAGIYRVFGHSVIALGLAQIAVSLLVCLCIYHIGKLLYAPACGLWAAAGFALYPEAIYWAPFPMKDSLVALELALILYSALCLARRRRSFLFGAVFAVASGALYATRPVYIVFPILALFLALLYRLPSWRWRLACVAVAGVGLWQLSPLIAKVIEPSLPRTIWDPVLREFVPSSTLHRAWYHPSFLLPRLALAARDVWAVVPREGYGRWGVLLGPFTFAMLATGVYGVMKSAWEWKKNSYWLLVAIPLLCFTFLLGITVFGIRFRYPLLPLMWVFAGYGMYSLARSIRSKMRRIEKDDRVGG